MKIETILNLIRWDKPAGTILLFLPCLFGVALNCEVDIDFGLLFLFLLGSFVMRSVGCIINDIFDKEFDGKVERTKDRPLAIGEVTTKHAIILALCFSFIGLLVLLKLSLETIFVALCSIPLIFIYPLIKRYSFFPQVILGFTFNFGILIASSELKGGITLASVILYLGSVFWTMGYDTIYAFMDIEDDKKIGVKSLAIWIEDKNYKHILASFYGVFFLSIIIASAVANHGLRSYNYIGLFLLMLQFLWQIILLDVTKKENCMSRFKSNMFAGIFIFMSLI